MTLTVDKQVFKRLRNALRARPRLVLPTFNSAHSLGFFSAHLGEHSDNGCLLLIAYPTGLEVKALAAECGVVYSGFPALGCVSGCCVWWQQGVVRLGSVPARTW